MLPSGQFPTSVASARSDSGSAPLNQLRDALLDTRTAHPSLIGQLAPLMPESSLPRALAVALGLHDDRLSAEVIAALTPHLKNASENVLEEVLTVMRAVVILVHGETEPDLMEALLPNVSWQLLPAFLELAIRIGDPEPRFRVLANIANRFTPEKKEEMLRKALDVVATKLPPVGTKEDETSSNVYEIITCLQGLIPHLPPSLQSRCLEITRAIPETYHRCHLLAYLLPVTPIEEQSALFAEIGLLSLFEDERYRKMEYTSGEYRIDFRAGLIATIPQPFKSDLTKRTLNLAYLMVGEPHKSALLELLPHLKEPEKTRVGRELLEIARQLPEEISDDVPSLRRYGEHHTKAELLSALWSDLPEPLQSEALAMVASLTNERERLITFYRRLEASEWKGASVPSNLLEEVLRQTRNATNSSLRVDVFVEIARHFPHSQKEQIIEESLDAALTLPNRSQQNEGRYWEENERADALKRLASSLSPDLLRRALVAVRDLDGEDVRARVLESMLPHLIVSLPEEFVLTVKELTDPSNRISQLCRAIPYMSPSFHAEIYEQVTADLKRLQIQASANASMEANPDGFTPLNHFYVGLSEALPLLCSEKPEATIEQITAIAEPNERADLFHAAAAYLTEPYQSHAIAEGIKGARDSDDFYTRTRILASLSSYLNESTRSQVLRDAVDSMLAAAQDVAKATENGDTQAGDVADETFSGAIAQEDGPQNVQLDWLTDLAPYLTVPILREAIVRARELTDEIVRATTLSRLLAALAGLLPVGAERDALFYEALELAFLNPFFPERGGDGAPEDPEGVPVSPERVKQLWAQLSPDEQIQITGEFLSVIGGRLGGPATQAANTELDRLDRSKAGLTLTPNQSAAIPPASLSENPILVVEQRQSAPNRQSSIHAVTAATPRYLQSRFPERVHLGERLPLQIRVSREMGDAQIQLVSATLQE